MSTQQKVRLQEPLTDEAIADFLEADPDFFRRHPSLTRQLRIPHETGEAVSLILYQVQLLRTENRRLKQRLDDLLDVARDNDRLAERMHRLTLELLNPSDLDHTLQSLKDGLRSQFQADLVGIRLVDRTGTQPDHQDFVADGEPALEHVAQILRDGRPVCGQLSRDQLQFLFGDSSESVASAAMVALRHPAATGVLGIGSQDQDRFHASQGTIFLNQLGELAAHALARHLAAA
ncbi:MAG: DUF484 family protein [Ectothiorhodospiraceae bacterium]|nr:DUF484 family protein [Ectothiorhodospiraceae bacterium]MCH8504632.1 DUF484 family protein [Ectothiorhodospiraceae bacterium]